MRANVSLTLSFQLTPHLYVSLDTHSPLSDTVCHICEQCSVWALLLLQGSPQRLYLGLQATSCSGLSELQLRQDIIWLQSICLTLFSQIDPLCFLRCPSCCLLSFGGRSWWPPSDPHSPESCLTPISSFLISPTCWCPSSWWWASWWSLEQAWPL